MIDELVLWNRLVCAQEQKAEESVELAGRDRNALAVAPDLERAKDAELESHLEPTLAPAAADLYERVERY
jgi:hypothetical protein